MNDGDNELENSAYEQLCQWVAKQVAYDGNGDIMQRAKQLHNNNNNNECKICTLREL